MSSDNTGKTTRHQARVMAFEFLFANLPDPKTGAAATRPADQTKEAQTVLRSLPFDRTQFTEFTSNDDDFAWTLVLGTGNNLPAIDASIRAVLEHWKIERIARIDLTILRLAGFEILFKDDAPKPVVINEAVELAKTYGEKDSPSFINGILDKLTCPILK